MIRRVLHVVLVLGLVAAAWVVRPVVAEPDIDPGFEPDLPTFVGCIGLVERSTDSSVLVGSVVRGDVTFSRVPAGEGASARVPVDPAGGASIDLTEIGAAGVVGVLTEMPTADAGATVLAAGEDVVASASCTPASTDPILVLGGSTMTGESLDLVLTNPYAVDAVVNVGSSSENGEDSASEIASVLVPAGGTVVRQLSPLLPLRQSLSVRLDPQRGAVHAAVLQSTEADIAMSEGVAPAQDWWIPILSVRDSTARLVIATDSPLPVNVQIDGYGAGEVVDGVFEGTIEPRSQLDLPVSELGGTPLGLRISSDSPVAVAVVIDGPSTRAITPATTLSTDWLLPGSGAFEATRAWVFNPGEVEAELILQPLTEGKPARATTVPPDAAVSVAMESGGGGMLIRSTSEVAVLWSGRQGGFALGTGQPLAVLTE